MVTGVKGTGEKSAFVKLFLNLWALRLLGWGLSSVAYITCLPYMKLWVLSPGLEN